MLWSTLRFPAGDRVGVQLEEGLGHPKLQARFTKSMLICLKVIIQWFIGGWYFACGFSGQRVGWSRSGHRVKMSEEEQF